MPPGLPRRPRSLPRRLRAFAVLVALVALAASAGCESGVRTGPDPPPPDTDGDGLSDDLELALLRQYRPYWNFDPDEFLFPIPVEAWARAGGEVLAADEVTFVEYDDLATLLDAVERHAQGVMHPADPPLEGEPPCPAGCAGDAPVYAEATPLEGRPDLAWLQYWVFYGYDEKDTEFGIFNHRGDWEHVCVLAAVDSIGSPTAPPEGLHFHRHGDLSVVETAEWVACRPGAAGCAGSRHARVYVDRGGHGSWPVAGISPLGPHRGGRPGTGGLLESPIVPILPHPANADRLDDEVVRAFRGIWGHRDASTTNAGPAGPVVFDRLCGHDFLDRPTLADWTPPCRLQPAAAHPAAR